MREPAGTNDPNELPEILAQARIGGQSLCARAQDAEQLTRAVQGVLPPDLAPHCLWATSEKGTVFIVTDTSSWATRLRFEELCILEEASRAGVVKPGRLCVLIIPQSEWIAPSLIPADRG